MMVMMTIDHGHDYDLDDDDVEMEEEEEETPRGLRLEGSAVWKMSSRPPTSLPSLRRIVEW